VGGTDWDGYLVGNAYITNGALVLPGGGNSASPDGYVQLPNGIVSNDASITVECWLTDNAGLGWAEAWCFGDSSAGPGLTSGGTSYISMIPTSEANGFGGPDYRAAFNLTGADEDDVVEAAGNTLPLNVEEYSVVTYNFTSAIALLYLNGVVVGSNTIPTNLSPANYLDTNGVNNGDTFNNWIGRDEFSGDPMFTGSVDELRIWNAAVSPLFVALSSIAGPNVVVTNLTPLSVTVTVTNSMQGGQTQQASVTANFAQVTNAAVTSAVTLWTSSNPTVLSVNSSGFITALSGGNATVSATVGGTIGTSVSINVTLTVPSIVQEPLSLSRFVGEAAVFSVQVNGGDSSYQWSDGATPISGATNSLLVFGDVGFSNAGTYTVLITNPLGSTNSTAATLSVSAPVLMHRWSFNDPAGSLIDADSVGGADGTNVNAADLNGTGQVELPGGTVSGDPGASYVALPNGILSNLNSMTIELWVTDNAGAVWAEAYCFGDSTAGPGEANSGTNYISFIPTSGPGDMRAAFKLQAEQDVIYPSTTMPTNVEEYVVLAYDAPSTTATLYLNGVQVGINTGITITPASLGDTFNDWIGRDEYAGDPTFNGSVDELRIYSGALLPSDIVNSYVSGPNTVVIPGSDVPPAVTQAPVSVSLYPGQQAVFTVGAVGGQLSYQWSQGTSLIPGATNPSLTVDVASSDEVYNVSITNTLGKTNATATLTVIEPTLVHRWSFNDPAGSLTDADSVGGANGTNMGNAFINTTDGTIVLPDTNTTSLSPNASYVQFPPGLLTNLNSATIEVWATDNGPETWAEIWSFGGSTAGPNNTTAETNYIGLIPHSGPGDMRAAFKILSEEDVIWPNTTMPINVEEDVALTYDNTLTTAILYLNGVAVAVNTNITITPAELGNTYNNYLGRDQFNDSIFHGSVDELRIYAGPLTPTDIDNNHDSGPNTLVGPGTTNLDKPVLAQAPVSLALYDGQTAVFTAVAYGGQLTYQWSHGQGASAILGATNASLTLTDVGSSDAGSYSVAIVNSVGTTTATATLTVTEPTLVHRWSFNDPAGSLTDADSVGGANGTNMGKAYIDTTNGTIVLPDTNTTSTTAGASYVQFPPGLLTNLNSTTIEVWATDNGPRTWAEIYSFGGSTAGPNDIDNQTNYIGFIPTSGPGDMRAAFKLLSEQDVIWPSTTMPTNVEEDVALTYDNTLTTAILYLNGAVVAVNTNITITPAELGNTYNNYVGRDQFEDNIFHGSVDELRIYAGPLTATDIENNHGFGPNTLVSPGSKSELAVGIARSGTSVVISWNTGALLQAPTLLGPWTTNTTAVSPFTAPATNKSEFYKVLVNP
jgi:hypothetical protein